MILEGLYPDNHSLFYYMKWKPERNFFTEPEIMFNSIRSFNDPFEGQFAEAAWQFEDSEGPEIFARLTGLSNPMLQYPHIGILCLTDNPLNQLMWAHYANEHKGLVLEFDVTHKFFDQNFTFSTVFPGLSYLEPEANKRLDERCELFGRPLKVNYRSDRYIPHKHLKISFEEELKLKIKNNEPIPITGKERLPINVDSSEVDLIEQLHPLFIKGTEWAYENEYRMLLHTEASGRLISLPDECVKSVFIGCKADFNKIVNEIMLAREKHNLFKDMRICHVGRAENLYQLSFTQYNALPKKQI